MDVKALQFCSRFALEPNFLGYCGKDSARARLKNCIDKGQCAGVEAELEKFIVLNPYLETISKITGRPKFSYEVVESYWLGNDLCKKAKLHHYDLLLENFAKQGVPPWLINELKMNRPKTFIPTHLFQVLHVGVGRASGSVPFNLETIKKCMITTKTVGGKIIAMHWNKPAKVLTAEEVKKLQFWNTEILRRVTPLPKE